MTCRQFIEMIADHASAPLPAPKRAVFEKHRGFCEPCAGYLRSYEETIRFEQEAFEDPAEPAPADAPESLIRRILSGRPKGR